MGYVIFRILFLFVLYVFMKPAWVCYMSYSSVSEFQRVYISTHPASYNCVL